MWPPLVVDKLDEPDPWKPPVDPVTRAGAMEQLAELIAVRVADWLATGELLESKGRPVEAGDILVLVRQRGAFVEALVRAFKARGVPVAGVDRMVLSEQIAVMDLLALGALDGAYERGCRVPEDCWIMGFDDVEQASWSTLSLTTVRQPVQKIVEDGVNLLLERLAEPALEPRRIVHPVDLMIRRSTARARLGTNDEAKT